MLVGNKINLTNIVANSATVREFMMIMQPDICLKAEAISSNVHYFAISQLGQSPIEFDDELTGSKKIGPDPAKMDPRHITDPTFWVLSQITPKLIPTTVCSN